MQEKSSIEISEEEKKVSLRQIRNLSDVYGFTLPSRESGKCLILCGKNRRWGNSYKKYAIHSDMDDLFANLKKIIGSGCKVFEVQ